MIGRLTQGGPSIPLRSPARLVNENTRLTGVVKTNTDLLDEIHLHVANIGKKVGAGMGRFARGRPTTRPATSS